MYTCEKKGYNVKETNKRDVPPIVFGVSFNSNLQSPWSLFNGTWQKRLGELEHRLRSEIEDDTPNAIGCTDFLFFPTHAWHVWTNPPKKQFIREMYISETSYIHKKRAYSCQKKAVYVKEISSRDVLTLLPPSHASDMYEQPLQKNRKMTVVPVLL